MPEPEKDYITVDALKKSLSMAQENFADDDFERAVTAASRALDDVTNRRFWADAAADVVRTYNPRWADYVVVDDLCELTTVEVDRLGNDDWTTWTRNTDFVLEPQNAPADDKPWTGIRVHPRSSHRFPVAYPRSVKVTGKFGWSEVPSQIEQAAGIIAGKLIKRVRDAPFGMVPGIDGGAAVRIARHDPDVRMLIERLVRTDPVFGGA